MSILIESLTVVVRRVTLDATWPGGTDAYLAAALSGDSRALLACADDKLTAVSFARPESSDTLLDRLDDLGIVYVDDRRCVDIVCIDHAAGPLTRCDWIEWRRHPDGFTYAWLAGTDAGAVVAPCTRRRDFKGRGEMERMIQLAREDGLEFWLDLDTGRQVVGRSPRPYSR
jgi:hypothetical protein